MYDRRIFERIPSSLPVKFWEIEANTIGEGRACDISAGGIGLVTGKNIAKGTGLGMWVNIPDTDNPLYLEGRVAWSSEDNSQYRVGVELEQVKLLLLGRLLNREGTLYRGLENRP